MNKSIKTLLITIMIAGGSIPVNTSALASMQYDSKTGVYTRKKAPETHQKPVEDKGGQNNAISNPSASLYQNYGVRTAIAEEKEAEQIIKNNPTGNPGHTPSGLGGYNTKKAPRASGGSAKLGDTGKTLGGYAVRSVKVLENRNKANATSASQSQYSNATNNDYAYKKAGGKRNLNFSNIQQETNRSRRSNNYYSEYYGDAIKIYNQRGQRISPSISNINRTVIIVPRKGVTVTGIVTIDDPGRSITIKDPDGQKLTYQYTDMDALVNI